MYGSSPVMLRVFQLHWKLRRVEEDIKERRCNLKTFHFPLNWSVERIIKSRIYLCGPTFIYRKQETYRFAIEKVHTGEPQSPE